jgi:hypothetical protein
MAVEHARADQGGIGQRLHQSARPLEVVDVGRIGVVVMDQDLIRRRPAGLDRRSVSNILFNALLEPF